MRAYLWLSHTKMTLQLEIASALSLKTRDRAELFVANSYITLTTISAMQPMMRRTMPTFM